MVFFKQKTAYEMSRGDWSSDVCSSDLETVDGNEIRFLISGHPDIMDVTVKEVFNFPAGVDVVHIGMQNDLEHHPGVIRAAPAFLIQLSEIF